jgi:hypothetical protein
MARAAARWDERLAAPRRTGWRRAQGRRRHAAATLRADDEVVDVSLAQIARRC